MKSLGKYMIFLGRLVSNREPFRVYRKLFFEECILIGIDSLTIVVLVSVFIGAVMCLQTAFNLVSPIIPKYVISLVVRDMTLLEVAPTFTAIVFAGKVGSNIASTIGTMKITEQVDALEVMGINSASYLVLPKIMAGMFMYPILVILAGFLAILGGYIAGVLGGVITPDEYIYGIRSDFMQFSVTFSIVKAFVFSFLIVSISAYKGYFTDGGALEVGRASTKAVTNSCIAVLIADFFLAQFLV
ncbi:MAG: ABC transporter permease [Thalassobius sp.]|nr:ABC transporter permease [Thalassovita sp.]